MNILGFIVLMTFWSVQGAKDNVHEVLLTSFQCQMESAGIRGKNCEKERKMYAFHAEFLKDKKGFGNSEIVKYDNVILNVGEAYDSTTGFFTCPESGLYTFSWDTLTEPKHKFLSEFVVDGKVKARGFAQADHSNDYASASKTVAVQLEKDNKAWIRTHGSNGKQLDGEWSSFSGFKI